MTDNKDNTNIVKGDFSNSKMLKVVIIGDGGQGKSTLANLLCGEDHFEVCHQESEDCTKAPQGKYCTFNGTRCLLIDTPGAKFNDEETFWKNMLSCGETHMIIFIMKKQERTSGYGFFPCIFEQVRNFPHVIYWTGSPMQPPAESNLLFGKKNSCVLFKDSAEILSLREQISMLKESESCQIFHPLELIKSLRSTKDELGATKKELGETKEELQATKEELRLLKQEFESLRYLVAERTKADDYYREKCKLYLHKLNDVNTLVTKELVRDSNLDEARNPSKFYYKLTFFYLAVVSIGITVDARKVLKIKN